MGEQRSLRADPPEHRRGADAHRPTRGGVPQGSQRATGGNPGQCADALGGAVLGAPVSGYVAGLKVFTDGGVIGPGELLMYIVPNSDSLEVEGQLAVNLVDRIHSGLPVEMLFTAFNQSKTPRVTGEVTMVSADRLLDEQNKQPYYALRAQVDAAAMGKLKGLQIRPGMAVQVFVRTGERSLLNYLFKPLFDRAHVALAEN
ncbi:HlyD family secretion protein [Pseudomonas aeruginosa]|uniref:HlyD family efflux transporter periplasmic adaptor subunit n=1 Tax=Pseudomonas aeruginosa TaxID=287 RepID=UPI00307C14E2